MTTPIQRLRNVDAILATLTLPDGVLTWSQDAKIVRMHDGVTPGGIKMVRADAAAITGGTINGTAIGGTAPAAGAFTALSASGNAQITGIMAAKHLVGNGATPGMTTNIGAGTSPTGVTITGTDVAGKISFTAGTSPTANGQIVLLTFSAGFTSAPFTVFSPNSSGAAALSGPTAIQASTSAAQMAFTAGPTPLTAGTLYSWFYYNIG